jgi:TPR repeat protein
MSIKSLLAALVVSLSLVAPALAGPWEDGEAAFNRGDYGPALWLLFLSATQDIAYSQYKLGVVYQRGWGAPQDYAEAIKWYRKAAEQGYVKAQYNLGFMNHRGHGVPQDDAKAVVWYRKAAEQGMAEAQYNLGLMYARGMGVSQDYLEAHKWLNLAASRGTKRAIKDREIVAKKMTPAQIAEARRLAHEWRSHTIENTDLSDSKSAKLMLYIVQFFITIVMTVWVYKVVDRHGEPKPWLWAIGAFIFWAPVVTVAGFKYDETAMKVVGSIALCITAVILIIFVIMPLSLILLSR